MKLPSELYYTKSHEWARVKGDIVECGISDYAQEEITDVVHVELPERGKEVQQGDPVAVVESVKAAFDIYAPVSGTIAEVNDELPDHPEWVNEDPYGRGWFFAVRMSDKADLDRLLSAADYEAHLQAE